MSRYTYSESTSDSGHDVEHFRVTSCGDITVVVPENGVEKRWHEGVVDVFEILRLSDEGLHQLEDFLLDCSQLSDFWSLGGNETWKTVSKQV